MKKVFPKGFLWGAGTSAHQVEGNTHNNWSVWEQKNAKILSRIGYQPLIKVWSEVKFHLKDSWTTLEHQTQTIQNYISGRACDHFNRYEDDFDFLSAMNLNCYRCSLEWSRIEPTEDFFDIEAIEHYRKMLIALKKRHIVPMVTLWHWTHPIWFEKQGAWTNPKSVDYFQRFVTKIIKEFKNLVEYWIILNEPNIYSLPAYLFGTKPAPIKGLFAYKKAIGNLVKAHKKSYCLIKTIHPCSQVGIAEHIVDLQSFSNNPLNVLLTKGLDLWNKSFLRQIHHHLDFVGINYYHHFDVKFDQDILTYKKKIVTDLGWNIHPNGLYDTIKSIASFKKPIIITENGVADQTDQIRQKYIPQIVDNLQRAISEGFDVRGYIHWSLMDNFEWREGFWPRFGLVEINYQDLSRNLRPSGKIYADIITHKKL
jgi:beta-glucosidase